MEDKSNANKGYVFTLGIPFSGYINTRSIMYMYTPYWLGFTYTTDEHEYLIYCFSYLDMNAAGESKGFKIINKIPATIFYI